MSKPNLIEIVKNENRITELESLLPKKVQEWLQVPKSNVERYETLKLGIEQLQLEYKERKERKERNYR